LLGWPTGLPPTILFVEGGIMMKILTLRWLGLGILAVGVAAIPVDRAAVAQERTPEGIEVLARGPVHEAFATTAEMPIAGPVITQLPPGPIEELPPDQKPEGDNVQWIPGYWHFEEEKLDFIWISGFWRVPPPGRAWIAGSWREVPGGRQWIHGFWQEVVAAQQLEYLPPPPQPLELAPSVPSPTQTSFYVPGSWVWRNRYVWRPGFWIEHRPGWIWVPAQYRYTPGGFIHVDGYWDYPIAERGVLFAPVAFAPAYISRPAFVYTPVYAVSPTCMTSALFIRRGWSCYYFGDYFEPRYNNIGFSAWCGSPRGTNFAITVGFGRSVSYDPLWSYYQVHHHRDPVWVNQINEVYVGRYRGDIARPSRTLVQQNTVINNITNVTNVTNVTNNNTTVVNNKTINNTNIANNSTVNNTLLMVQPLKTINQTNTNVVLKPVAKDEQAKEQQLAKQVRDVGTQRSKAETQLADRQQTPLQPTDKVRQVKLDVPQQVVARAQAPQTPAKVLPPKPTLQQAQLNANAPATIPPSDTAKPNKPTSVTPAPINPAPVTKPTPTPAVVTPAPVTKPLPTPAPVMPAPATKPLPTPTPSQPLPTPTTKPAPAPVTPAPQPPKIGLPPATPAPQPVAKPLPVMPTPQPVAPPPVTKPLPVAPAPQPIAPPPAKPSGVPLPAIPQVKPAPPMTPPPAPQQPAKPPVKQEPKKPGETK
jgi:hypothetical protein